MSAGEGSAEDPGQPESPVHVPLGVDQPAPAQEYSSWQQLTAAGVCSAAVR